jgi:nicotinamidase-related amidase
MGCWRRLLEASERFDTPEGGVDNRQRSPMTSEGRVFKLDDKLHQMLRELRRALSEAISESSDVSRTLRKIREEGYSLYLLVDCKRELNDPDALALTAPRWPSSSAEPAFQIDGRDLSFLKSIGIDPTRRLRRRRANAGSPG